MSWSLGDYDADRYGPFLGISDEGSAAAAIAEAALASPKAQALTEPTALEVGVAHDAERLGSLGEVPVGPDEYETIRSVSRDRVLLSTNVGSHVAMWYYRQPLSLHISAGDGTQQIAAWAAEQGAGLRERNPRPWLRLNLDPGIGRDAALEAVRAAAERAPVAVAVRAEQGKVAAHAAIELAADGGAEAAVIDGTARPPTAARAASPGLLNYFEANEARELLATADGRGISIEPALKFDTDSVANQIWSGLYAARGNGLNLGKYGLFPLTMTEAARVIERVEGWFQDWTTAPALYLDVPVVDGAQIYDLEEAAVAAKRWLEVAADAGASVVLIDTVEKSRRLHLVKTGAEDEMGILSWQQLDELHDLGSRLGVRILWAGGIPLSQLREFGNRRPFGLYVTSAVSTEAPLEPGEEDIGLNSTKEPLREKILLAKILLEAGFLADPDLDGDAAGAEAEDAAASERLATALKTRWHERLRDGDGAS